jgi:hypothetical protein
MAHENPGTTPEQGLILGVIIEDKTPDYRSF